MKVYKTKDILQDCLMSFAFRNKYDVQSNDLVRKIFDRIKNNRTGEFSEDGIWVEISRQKIRKPTFENFYVGAITKNGRIYISIFLDKDFSEKDYQRMNFVLYEVIRHELEHFDKFVMGEKPDEEYVQLYNDLRSKHNIKEHVELVAKYILSPTEIDSYVKSIIYVAKKQKKLAIEVIEMVIKRAFFGNDSVTMADALRDMEIKVVVSGVREKLRGKIREYYPSFKEEWL